jgi:hypothetical protein
MIQFGVNNERRMFCQCMLGAFHLNNLSKFPVIKLAIIKIRLAFSDGEFQMLGATAKHFFLLSLSN